MADVFKYVIVCMTVLLTSISVSTKVKCVCMCSKGVWISQTSGDTEILDKSDLWRH